MSEQQPVFCAPSLQDARHGAVPASLWDVDASAEVLRAGDSAAALRQSVPIILGGAQRGSHAPNATPLSESIDSFRDGIGGGGGGGLGGLAAPPSLVTSGLAAAAAASGDLSRFHLQGGLASPLQPEDADRQQQYRPMCPTESSCSSLAHAEEDAAPPPPPPPPLQVQQQAAPQHVRPPPALAAEQTSSKASMKKRRIRGRHVVLCAAALLLLLAACGGAVAAVLAATGGAGGDVSGEPEVGGGGGGGGGGRRSAWFGCPGCAHDRECVQAKHRADATLKKLEACVQKLEHTKGDEDVCREEATALRSQVDTEKRARSVLQADITRAEEGLETSQADAALLVAATAAAAALLTALCLRRSAKRAEDAASGGGGQDGAASAAPQKFKLGDVVEFPVHDGWRVGRVIKTVRKKEDGAETAQGGATLYAVRIISGPRIFDDDSDTSVPEAEEEYVPEADARRVIVRVEKAPTVSIAEPPTPPPPPPPEKVYVEVINEVEKPCKACPGLQKEVEALRTQVEAGRAAHAEALDALRQSTRREVKEQMRRHEEDDALRTERLVALASRELEESLTKERRRRRDAEGEAHRLADLVREAEVRDLAAETLVEQINSNAAAAAAAFLTAVLKKSDGTQTNRQR